jgi:hypothetical protein
MPLNKAGIQNFTSREISDRVRSTTSTLDRRCSGKKIADENGGQKIDASLVSEIIRSYVG